MNNMRKIMCGVVGIWSVVLLAEVPTGAVVQNVPGQISYQGVLANPTTGGRYADGVYELDVRIWNSETRKSGCLWGAKYKVPVKDGVFSLVLGDAAALDLEAPDGEMPQYGKGELWKALWGDDAEDTTRFLGVTPHEDARCAPLSVLAEISPRHRLLAAPFAFRAEKAQYADASQGDFTIAGQLTVGGQMVYAGGLNVTDKTRTHYFGPIRTTDEAVFVGNEKTASATSPNLYVSGASLVFRSVANLTLGSVLGNMVFSIPRTMLFSGDGSFVANTAVNSLGGRGATAIAGSKITLQGPDGNGVKYVQTANGVSISGGSGGVQNGSAKTQIECTQGGAAVNYKSTRPCLVSWNRAQYFDVDHDGFTCGGPFRWNFGGSLQSPVRFRTMNITLDAGYAGKSSPLSNRISQYYLANYHWFPCGWSTDNGLALGAVRVEKKDGDEVELRVLKHIDYTQQQYNVTVFLMGIPKAWTQSW